jgi:hypothetical protein
MKAIDPQKFFAPQKILKVPRAYESLNPGLLVDQQKIAKVQKLYESMLVKSTPCAGVE